MSDYVLLSQIAKDLSIDRSNVRRMILESGFTFHRVKSHASGGQQCLALTASDADAFRFMRTQTFIDASEQSRIYNRDQSFFYIVQPVPELCEARVKLGITNSLKQRLTVYTCVCPHARIVKSWPCQIVWEAAAIASITRMECNRLGDELFECADMGTLIERADAFFALMPMEQACDNIGLPEED